LKKTITVQTLIGINQLDFYLKCIDSLFLYSEEEIIVHFHTDGTILEKQKDLIISHFSNWPVKFTDFNKNKEIVLDSLSGKPNCQRFRKDSIWGIEFFDPLFSNPTEKISFFLDADILFLRPFTGLFDRSQVKDGAVFIKDTQWDAYCIRPWHLIGNRKKPDLVEGITTGLIFWDKSAIDWDYLEWFLGASNLHKITEWIMPTAQAGLANRCNAKTICPKQIINLYPNAEIHDDTLGVHLLGSYRKDWIEKLAKEGNHQNQNDHITKTRFEACRTQNIIGYSLKQMKRWKNTRLNLW
tara:strand:- start:1025 stop:1915 length:891 start_codon:yes stop_codon:yes gene_type:complete